MDTNNVVIVQSMAAILHRLSASLMDAGDWQENIHLAEEALTKTLNPQPQSCPSFTSWTLLFEVGMSPVTV